MPGLSILLSALILSPLVLASLRGVDVSVLSGCHPRAYKVA